MIGPMRLSTKTVTHAPLIHLAMSHGTCSPDLGLLASGAVIFAVQRLVPTYDNSFYLTLKKPE